jgi:hypothetical protein
MRVRQFCACVAVTAVTHCLLYPYLVIALWAPLKGTEFTETHKLRHVSGCDCGLGVLPVSPDTSQRVDALSRLEDECHVAGNLSRDFMSVYWHSFASCRHRMRIHSSSLSRKVAGSIPGEVVAFFNWPNPSSRTMALGSTQPLTEMETRNGRPAREAHNLTAICEPTV